MKAQNILIGLVLFSLFISGAFYLVGDLFPSYSASYNDSSSQYDVINNVTVKINTMQTQISDSSTSDFGFALGAWQAVKLLLDIPSIIATLINAIAIEFGIPAIFIGAFLAIAGIMVIFIIIGAVFKVKI